ncbi:MAG: hypothetical protein A2X55_01680 [Nitrospirae bacterium GWB2_47_37]|nr:MAG: hypothetical protein A2Z82_07980 [Nitrospirae bacterium GWA2_46_11]OGW25778.1 MAG: hypothetical protein A2X55_01680 [Nitrospirae bacterium GWB2_47_37]HAK89174.1 hypothetical protein [Nitrospiraceae bacterium]
MNADDMHLYPDLYGRLYNTFVDNAREWLTELENGLLSLEKNPYGKEDVNHIFRIAHNMKSSSGTIGLDCIYRYAHSVEDLLLLMRDGKLIVDKALIDLLLLAVDVMWEMVEAAALKKPLESMVCEKLIQQIEMYKSCCV